MCWKPSEVRPAPATPSAEIIGIAQMARRYAWHSACSSRCWYLEERASPARRQPGKVASRDKRGYDSCDCNRKERAENPRAPGLPNDERGRRETGSSG